MVVNIFWFRRDLRLHDNHGLFRALKSGLPVVPIFIFDTNILEKLSPDDRRVAFIHQEIARLKMQFDEINSSFLIKVGRPIDVFSETIRLMAVNSDKSSDGFTIDTVYANSDYEPYAVERDSAIRKLLASNGIQFKTFNDHVFFEPGSIMTSDKKPYEVFTPFRKKWMEMMLNGKISQYDSWSLKSNFIKIAESIFASGKGPELNLKMPSLRELGFNESNITFPSKEIPVSKLQQYAVTRDIPRLDSTTRLGVHLRFGTISIRGCINSAIEYSDVWLNELIWREFFIHILAHYPRVVDHAFRSPYDNIKWINDTKDFAKWCKGLTGYPLVDAGMRELKETGFMHNRVRMVTASFLVKHLLIDWRWGEAWFAEHLLDYELASNNGNWQWAAGTGCDAAPYFRIFNPVRQQERFDPDFIYVKKWVPELETSGYPEAIIDHKAARERCLIAYKEAIQGT